MVTRKGDVRLNLTDSQERSRRAWVRRHSGPGFHPKIRQSFDYDDRLFHGTALGNVRSILKQGLLPRQTLLERDIRPRPRYRDTSETTASLLADHVAVSLSPLHWALERPHGAGNSALLVVEPAAVTWGSFWVRSATYIGFDSPGASRDTSVLKALVEEARRGETQAEIWIPKGIAVEYIRQVLVPDARWVSPVSDAAADVGASVDVAVREGLVG